MSEAAESTLEDELEKLVKAVVQAATGAEVKLSDRLEVLKICSQHYVNLSRVKGKKPPPDGGGTTMDGLRGRVDSSSQQGDDDEQTSNGE